MIDHNDWHDCKWEWCTENVCSPCFPQTMLKQGLFLSPVSIQSDRRNITYSDEMGREHGSILHKDDNPPELRRDIICM